MTNAVNTGNGLNYDQFTQDKIASDKAKELSQNVGKANPKGVLDKDAFMKLLLTELKYQDPTSPMDSSKMLEQTSQLATLETQQNTNKMMQGLAKQMKSYSNLNALSALGTMVKYGSGEVIKSNSDDIKIKIYVPEFAKEGEYQIYDKTGEKLISTTKFGNAPAGLHEITWDGKDDNRKEVENGSYIVKVKYKNKDGAVRVANYGEYPIEAVKFINGKPKVKIAGEFTDIDKISEFYRI